MLGRVLNAALLASMPTAAWAQVVGCEAAVTSVEIDRSIADAELAFTNLDVTGFFDASDGVREQLGCLSEPLTRKLAARIHRYEGLRFVLERNTVSAAKSFAAARSIEPDYRFPSTLVPSGNPVHEYYLQDPVAGVEVHEVPMPAVGSITFDGSSVLEHHTPWPTVMQFLDDAGVVTATVYVRAQEPLPAYEVATEEQVEATKLPATSPPAPAKPVVPLAAAASGALLISGVSLGLAASSNRQFWDDETDYDDLAGLKGRSNAYMGLSIGSAALAIGAGAGLAIVVVK